MTSPQLENLVKTGCLKAEPPSQSECDGLLHSAKVRLIDACNTVLSMESRFDLAYNASHALALGALRWHGYRSDNRYIVFQCLEHTLGTPPTVWRLLAQCHQLRNLSEYEGHLEVSDRLMAELIEAVEAVQEQVGAMTPINA